MKFIKTWKQIQSGKERYAILFKPGEYDTALSVNVVITHRYQDLEFYLQIQILTSCGSTLTGCIIMQHAISGEVQRIFQ